AAGPNRAIAGPATTNEKNGTISGPGATERPVFSADQPHTSCSHRTIDSSMPPKASEKSAATDVAPEYARLRNSEGGTSGLWWRRQRATNAASVTSAAVRTSTVVLEPQPQER